jgi:LuxR family transcriptional regulator, maltose regulon positive regulatory protein
MTAMISDSSTSAHRNGKPSARSTGAQMSDAFTRPRLAHSDRPATAMVMPLPDVPGADQAWVMAASLLGTIVRAALGDPDAAGRALQRALDFAEHDQVLLPFLIDPPPGLFERQAQHHIADASPSYETADLLSGATGPASAPGKPAGRLDALTHGETRVLRYLPTNLSAREIAGELCLSVNTVKTHQRHLYQKLGARSRTQAVKQARALGLLAPSSHRR